ncbi:hypothetical protein BDQ17DRAFT_1344790 [Cyathus striatus]|nr:hypothetical protein BDQ17DRAFT_1344790 [Cyathus striatus]
MIPHHASWRTFVVIFLSSEVSQSSAAPPLTHQIRFRTGVTTRKNGMIALIKATVGYYGSVGDEFSDQASPPMNRV